MCFVVSIKVFIRKIITAFKLFIWTPVSIRLERGKYRASLVKIRHEITTDEITLYFGETLERFKGGVVSGGAVKLLNLRENFPESREGFNILYLVSSSLPPFADELIDWAHERGAKFVLNQNGVAYPAWAGKNYHRQNAPLEAALTRADFIFYQSEFCKQSVGKFLRQKDEIPYKILYNAVDAEYFTLPGTKPDLKQWQLLCMGSHGEAYRIMNALEALRILKSRKYPARLTIGGRILWAEGVREVNDFINDFGLKDDVVLLPPYSQEQAPGIYQNAHILLHTQYNDASPTVPLEAMACGVPVIANTSGGLDELVNEACGYKVPVKKSYDEIHAPDPEKIADGVVKIMGDWEQFSLNARVHVKKDFDKKGWIEAHRQVFSDLF